MKIALVHDFLNKPGGAEKVLSSLSEIFPQAPIYTLVYDNNYTSKAFPGRTIYGSVLQKYPDFIKKRLKYLLQKMPQAIEEFDFSDYDVVISSSNSFAHGVITSPKTLHICYCHSPMRYAWDWSNEYLKENNASRGLKSIIIRAVISKIRIWDRITADRVDLWLANSINVARRINKYYKKDSIVVYPPVDIPVTEKAIKEKLYYFISSRLEPYKKIDLAVKAFNKNGKLLYIAGDGSQFQFLRSVAKPNIKFLGWQSTDSVFNYLEKAKAFIFPGEDDFGIAPVEAMAAGVPVIAYKKGGVLETIIENKTGIFFDEESPSSLGESISRFEKLVFDSKECKKQAEKFSKERFKNKILNIINKHSNL